jgi:pimeloyl-ACP methyl ester carboxylesterase
VFGTALALSTGTLRLAREKYAEWGPVQPDRPASHLERRYTDDASAFVEVGGARVHYRDEGPRDAPVLLALHGTYSSLHTWDGWVDAFGDQVRVVRLDLPGFGLTGPNEDREYSLSYYTDFLAAFCDELGFDEVAVAGNSLGGAIAWRFAVTDPERVDRLLLLDAGRQQLVPEGAQQLLNLGVNVLPRYLTPRAMVRSILRDAYGDPSALSRETVRRYHDLLLRAGNRRAVIKLARAAGPAPFDPTAVPVPTLVQWGSEDEWLPPALGEQFAAEIPDATLTIYDGVGHVLMEEAPERTASDALAFLQS